MNIIKPHLLFKMKSVLCALLMFYAPLIMAGCGNNLIGIDGALSQLQIPLSPDDPLTQALAGTSFQGAVAINVLPGSQQFRLVFRDDVRQVSGHYSIEGGSFTISEFTFKNSDGSATVRLDGQRRVQSITSWDGESWSRPADSASRESVAGYSNFDNPYSAANADLIRVAQELDAGGYTPAVPNSPGSSPNAGPALDGVKLNTADPLDQDDHNGLRNVLTVIAAIWAPLAGLLTPLLAFFSVASIVENAMKLRFDGTWNATNANSNLQVTINGGKIVKLVDTDSGFELTIIDSILDRLDGNHVVWKVNAGVLGQSSSVEFEFDVQEQSNGTLAGTLTVLGATFARVALTMTRV